VKETAERSRRMSSLTKLQSSTRYGGAKPFSALNTSVAILNSTRRRTGSQCSSRRTGVICSHQAINQLINQSTPRTRAMGFEASRLFPVSVDQLAHVVTLL